MPSTLDDYDTYYYQFNDTLGTEFTLIDNETVKGIDATDFTVTVVNDTDETEIPATQGTNYNWVVEVDEDTGSIQVTFGDVKSLVDSEGQTVTVNANSIITVDYNAKLNNTAVIGLDGQTNAVSLTYANNPNTTSGGWTDSSSGGSGGGDGTGGDGEGGGSSTPTPITPTDTGETPEDKVIVFTYALDVSKVNGADGKALTGAGFKLLDSTGKNVANFDSNHYFTGWTNYTGTNGTELAAKSGDDTGALFEIKGLDEGEYKLVESTVPSGFNGVGTVSVVLTATTVNNQTWDMTKANTALTDLAVTADSKDGTVDDKKGTATVTIANNKGTSLPSTGGIGTTIFYLSGGILVVGAGVSLIAKKRMKDAE
jgi:LPXTG-motif cell wall-anchored protein